MGVLYALTGLAIAAVILYGAYRISVWRTR